MNPFEMVIGIVLITAVASIFRARYGVLKDRKGREYYVHQKQDNAESERLREEVKVLKERVAVLERIATDKHNLLEQEFERLKDRE